MNERSLLDPVVQQRMVMDTIMVVGQAINLITHTIHRMDTMIHITVVVVVGEIRVTMTGITITRIIITTTIVGNTTMMIDRITVSA